MLGRSQIWEEIWDKMWEERLFSQKVQYNEL